MDAPALNDVLKAIDTIKAHLDCDWITEECANNLTFGCGSCEAIYLRSKLTSLANTLLEDEGCSKTAS